MTDITISTAVFSSVSSPSTVVASSITYTIGTFTSITPPSVP